MQLSGLVLWPPPSALMLLPIGDRRTPICLLEHLVEIRNITESNRGNNIHNLQVSSGKEMAGSIHAHHMEELDEGCPGIPLE